MSKDWTIDDIPDQRGRVVIVTGSTYNSGAGISAGAPPNQPSSFCAPWHANKNPMTMRVRA